MPEEIVPTEESQKEETQETGEETPKPVEEKKEKRWLKPLLFSILGIILAGGLVFAGYKFAQIKQVQPGPQSTPTPESVSTPTPVAEATPTPDPTADWKTYTNTKYGYLIKYPDDFFIEKFAVPPVALDSVTFLLVKYKDQELPQKPSIGISVYYDEGLSVGDWLKKHSTNKPFGSIEDSTIYYFGVEIVGMAQDGLEWMIFSDEVAGVEKMSRRIIGMNGKIYALYYANLLGEELEPIFDLMLSTFRFLPSTSSGQGE